ncbi:MAG: L,D-transpeptidase family protein [Candidatus Micrarchaeota archaeon]|nr:L,D-transpeptidase family protein [Candidatus Micrarchaeota archaeon]
MLNFKYGTKNFVKKALKAVGIFLSSGALVAQEPNFRFSINLPEFKNILYENEKAIDSSVICPGGFRRRTPFLKVKQRVIYIRPSFYPTKAERNQFKAAWPDKTRQPQKPQNPLGRVKINLHNQEGLMIRIHGTSLVNSIGRFKNDTVTNYSFSSNGCIRNDNLSFERMIGRIIASSKIEKANDEIKRLIKEYTEGKIQSWEIINNTTLGKTAIVVLSQPIEIEVYYRLWQITNLTDSTIELKINRDIYNYLDGREERVIGSYELNNEKNAYKFEHFERDLKKAESVYYNQSKQINKLIEKEKKNLLWKNLKKEIKNNKIIGRKIQLKIP